MAITAALIAASVAIAATTTAIATAQQNAQIQYQQEVARQNAIAAQNKAAADMKLRREETMRQQASTRAKMAASGISSTTGSFLDMIGQGAAAGEMDVLKAKHDGDVEAWTLNNKINELETQKQNVALNAGLSGLQAGISTAATMGVGSGGAGSTSGISWGKAASGEKIGTDTSGKIYAPLSSGLS